MSTTREGSGRERDHSILASSRPEPAGQWCCGPAAATDGSGLSGISRDGGERPITGVRRRAGAGRTPGSALIAVAVWLLALTGGGALFVLFSAQHAYIFTVRRQRDRGAAAGPADDRVHAARARPGPGGPARPGRAGPDPGLRRRVRLHERVGRRRGSPRSAAAYAVAPVALAVVVGRAVAVIRRHVLADQEPSAWTTLGRAAAAAARITGLVLLYCLRFALAAPQTARGLRRMVLDAAPLPALPGARAGGDRAAPHQEGRPARPVPRSPRLRDLVITVSPSGSGRRACEVPNPPSPMITSGCATLNRASRSSWSGSPMAPGSLCRTSRMPKPLTCGPATREGARWRSRSPRVPGACRLRTARHGVRRRSPGGTGGRLRRPVRRSSRPGSGPARP